MTWGARSSTKSWKPIKLWDIRSPKTNFCHLDRQKDQKAESFQNMDFCVDSKNWCAKSGSSLSFTKECLRPGYCTDVCFWWRWFATADVSLMWDWVGELGMQHGFGHEINEITGCSKPLSMNFFALLFKSLNPCYGQWIWNVGRWFLCNFRPLYFISLYFRPCFKWLDTFCLSTFCQQPSTT